MLFDRTSKANHFGIRLEALHAKGPIPRLFYFKVFKRFPDKCVRAPIIEPIGSRPFVKISFTWDIISTTSSYKVY